MAISMLKIRRPLGRLIFNMGIAIPGKTVFLIETAPSRLNVLENSIILMSIGMAHSALQTNKNNVSKYIDNKSMLLFAIIKI